MLKIKTLLFLFIPYFFFSCSKEKKEVYDIILVAGQSNCYYGQFKDDYLDSGNESIMQLGRFDENDLKVIPAEEPLEHHSIAENSIGFAMTFSKLYMDKYLKKSHKILIIPCGFTGSGFAKSHWRKGDKLYEDAMMRVQFVLNKFPKSELRAILWHQGETDAYAKNKNYQLELDRMIHGMRNGLGFPNVPFILGGMVPYWVQQDSAFIEIQKIIKDTPSRIYHSGYADPEKPFLIEKPYNSYEQIHYDANGQREMGIRYFKEYEKLR